jgi:hypothetical protein
MVMSQQTQENQLTDYDSYTNDELLKDLSEISTSGNIKVNTKNKLVAFFSRFNDESYHKNNYYDLLELYSDKLATINFSNIILSLNTSRYIVLFFEFMVQCNLSSRLLEKNLYLLPKLNQRIILKLLKKSKYVNFMIIYKYLEKENKIDIYFKESLLNVIGSNYDDRVFKFCINTFDMVPDNSQFFMNLNTRPKKYFMRRLKFISKYLNNNRKKDLFSAITLCSYTQDTEDKLKMFFKYYYNFTMTEEMIKRFVCCLSASLFNDTENIEVPYDDYLNLLKTSEEKNLFNILCIDKTCRIVSTKYLDFNKISYDMFLNFYQKLRSDFIIINNNLSYLLDIIIRKAINSIHFKNCIKEINNTSKNIKYYIYGSSWENKQLYMLPYIKETQDTSDYRINYLYIKLKMFIHKIRMNKNTERNIMFKPVLFELLNFHSVKENNNIFKKSITSEFSKVPPQLMFPGEIELLHNFIIKEKADGELVYKLPDDIEPQFNLKCNIKAEYIESHDLYLVFDCDTKMSNADKYNLLRSNHYMTSGESMKQVNSMSQLVEYIETERDIFNSFMEKDYDNYRWYPKAAWEVITMDEKFINDMYEFINETSEYNSMILMNEYYENDGFIISPTDSDKEIKVKPRSLMTIDLEYNGKNFIDRDNNNYNIKVDNVKLQKGVYRCYPVGDDFVAKEFRYDKKKPNPYDVVNNIINLSKINYCIKKPLYYHNVEFKNNKKWNRIVKDNMSNLVNVNNFMYRNETVLDLGCGKSKVLKLNIDYKTYTGYDFDVYVLLKNMKNKVSNKDIRFNYVDLSNDWNNTKDKFYDVKYKKYMNIYAINSLMHFNTELFWEQIDKVSVKGTRFLFNILQSNKEINWADDNSYIRVNNDNVELFVELFFENVHSKPLIEKYVTINDIEKYLKQYKFKIIYKYSSTNSNITDYYEWYICEKVV